MRIRILVTLICLGLMTGAANAGIFSGYFNDQANTALVGSDLGPALFGDDNEIANNVALYSLTVPVAANVTFDCNGFAASGADPYFTLFQGNGSTATFLESNYAQAFSTGGDFLLTYALSTGDYQIAMGVFANMSFAENSGTGNLGDGFTGLGVPYYLGNYYYEMVVTQETSPVSEPSAILLLGSGLAGVAVIRKKFRM
jgi:hypothetical protein